MQSLINGKPSFVNVERVHETVYRAVPLLGTRLKTGDTTVKTTKGARSVCYNNLTGRLWLEVDKKHLGAYNVIDTTLEANTVSKNWKIYQGSFVSDWVMCTQADECYFTGVYSFSIDGHGGSRLFDDFETWAKFQFKGAFGIDLRKLIVNKRYTLEIWVQKVHDDYVVLGSFATDDSTKQYRGMGAEHANLCLFNADYKVQDFELDTSKVYQYATRFLAQRDEITDGEVNLLGGLTPMLKTADLFSVSGTQEFISKCQYAKQIKELWFDCPVIMAIEPNGIMVNVLTYKLGAVETYCRKSFVSLESLYGC